jgi:PAS domain S-box-containing protein
MPDPEERPRSGSRARDLPRVEHAVARILAETERPVEVYEATLQAIGQSLGWQLGAVWEASPDDGRLRCVTIWNAGQPAAEFEALTRELALAPGEGLPGRVLARGEPAWMVDAPEDANFPRAGAARRGDLHAGFCFPLRSPRGVVGVMEFFSREQRELDAAMLATMDALGNQVGQLVARRRAEEEVRANESRLRAMLDAALDAVVTMDEGGHVIGWNHAAEAIFGYPAAEAVGRDMAELIVPPALRDAHRRGLARYRDTERAVVLDRRLELTGMRRDGSEFPVELTITRIALPGPATFTGYLRDITDRTRANQELRASRSARRRASTSRCWTSRSTSSPRAWRTSASLPAACTRRCSPSEGSWRRSKRSPSGRPWRSSSRPCPTGDSPSRSRPPRTTSSPRPWPTCTSMRARAAPSSAPRPTTIAWWSPSSMTGSAAPTRREGACAASPIASRRLVAGSHSRARPAGGHGFGPTFP